MKELEINKDYGFVFGLRPEKGQHMIYLGGISFKAINGTQERISDSQGTLDKVSEYINHPTVKMGSLR